MTRLAIVFALGAATLLGGSEANAAGYNAQPVTDISESTDFSSRHRGYRHSRAYSRPYNRGYGYAPRRVYRASQPYYGGGYGYSGPVYGGGYGYGSISLGFGRGGFGRGHGGGYGRH